LVVAGGREHDASMQARLATVADVPELVRLRAVMIETVRGESDESWQAACTAILDVALADGTMTAVVVDQPEGPGLAACGVGMVGQRLPSPGCADGRYGYVQSMCTDERHRRQGLARLVFEGLMQWYADAGITRVDLHASSMGEPLYRQHGFTDPVEPELRWRAG
jgi:GNAT superfamily N-acetyltransferase